MKTVRHDADALVLRHKTLAPWLMLGLGIPGLGLILAPAIAHESVGAAQWGGLVALELLGVLFFCFCPAYEESITFSWAMKQALVVRKSIGRTTRRQFDFEQVNRVEVRPARHSFQIVFIVLDDGCKIGVNVQGTHAILQRQACEQTAALLRQVLGLGRPAADPVDHAEFPECELELAGVG